MVFHITSNICVVTGAHCVNTCSARCRRHVRFRWRTANNSVDRERHAPLPRPLYARRTATLTQAGSSARFHAASQPLGPTPRSLCQYFLPRAKTSHCIAHQTTVQAMAFDRFFCKRRNYSDLLRNPELLYTSK